MKEYRKKQKLIVGGNTNNKAGLKIDDWKYVLNLFDYKCAYCGSDTELEQDHIVPFFKNGKYEIGNIVPSCRRCNSSKGNKNLEDWYKQQDFFNDENLSKINMYIKTCKTNVSPLHKANVSLADKIRLDKIRLDKIRLDKIYDRNFETFYKAYPKKVQKSLVQKWFIKNKPNEELFEIMISVLEKQKQSKQWLKENGQYIPNPTTWLNQKRWEDETQENMSALKQMYKELGEEENE